MLKTLVLIGLVALGLGHALPAWAQHQHYYGWTRLVNAALAEEQGDPDGRCIEVPWGSKQIGTVLTMHACTSGDNQRFRLLDASFDNARIAVYSGMDERCLGYEPEGGKINITHCATAPRWKTGPTLSTIDGQSCVQIAGNGTLELVDDCNPFAPDPKSIFGSNWHMSTLGHPFGDDVVLFNDQYETCLEVRDGSTSPGADMMHSRCSHYPLQLFTLRGTKDEMFLTVYEGADMLCVSNVLEPGHPPSTRAVACNRWDSRQGWGSIRADYWAHLLFNASTGRCLDAFASSAVGTWDCHGGLNQRWQFAN